MSRIFKPSKKKLVISAITIILITAAVLMTGGKKQTPLQFAAVKRSDIKSTVSSSGNLAAKFTVDLKFKSSGKLAYLNVSSGDKVYAGQVIAGLDTRQLSIDLQQAQNTLKDKQAAAEKTLDDVKDHSKDESYTQKKDRTAAEVARDNAYDSVKEAQRAFQDAVIVSPIAGLVTKADPIAGQIVSAQEVIATVADFSQIFFDTDIDESDIGKVSAGQSAEVSLDAFPDKIFEGTVDKITPQTKTTSQGASVVTVRINLVSLEISHINGLSGQASIILAEARDALTIPWEALRDDNTVFVAENQDVQPKKVESGIKSDTDVEIIKGLLETDRVLLNPPSNRSIQRSQNPLNSLFRFLGGSRGGRFGEPSSNR